MPGCGGPRIGRCRPAIATRRSPHLWVRVGRERDSLPGPGPAKSAGRRRRRPDCPQLRLRLYSPQVHHAAQHAGRSDLWGPAPVIGWTAVRGSAERGAGVLFVLLFLWQVPHFLAIAWIYRADYERAGLRMLSAVDRGGGHDRPADGLLLPGPRRCQPRAVRRWRGRPVYLAGVLIRGIGFLACAVGFAQQRSLSRARLVLRGPWSTCRRC